MVLRGRKQVANFARRILATLNKPKNAAKPGWEDMSITEMMTKLDEEFSELGRELENLWLLLYGNQARVSAQELIELRRRIAEESTDLGAVCMMICDNVGGLDDT